MQSSLALTVSVAVNQLVKLPAIALGGSTADARRRIELRAALCDACLTAEATFLKFLIS